MEKSIQVKTGAIFKEINKFMLEALMGVDHCCKKYNRSYVITSVNDGHHSDNSYHYKNLALDIRLKDLPKSHWYVLRDTLKAALGKYFDLIIESENDPDNVHLHIEADMNKYNMDYIVGEF